ncbi:MAG: helix-turn-helix transcriptional regulator [Egibacteraceae bacterium]
MYDPASLGRAIAHFREQTHLKQADLADQSGLHRPYLSRLERGKATEQTERLFRVLRRLGLEVVVRRREDG